MNKILLTVSLLFTALTLSAQTSSSMKDYQYTPSEWKQIVYKSPDEFFRSDEAKRIADNVLLYQRVTGGWPKNIAIHQPLGDKRGTVLQDKQKRNDSTTDNNATILEIIYLARLYGQIPDKQYKDALLKGVEFLLSGQYKNGGWPQFWPENRTYQVHITYNDNAMVQTLRVIRDLRDGKAPFNQLVDKKLKSRLDNAFKKGIECILNTQIIVNGVPTVWCQQYDHTTLKPINARAFELASFCTAESVPLVELLMELPNPNKRIKAAVKGAIKWLDDHQLNGIRIEHFVNGDGKRDIRVVKDENAQPLWARFYDLEKAEPMFCDRNGIPVKTLAEVGYERRNGYSWYNQQPEDLKHRYELWKKEYVYKPHYDAVVSEGKSIQAAIEAAPQQPSKPYIILIKNGTYHEKVIIDRPYIVLVGESRDKTRIINAELASKQTVKEYKGKSVGNGVIVLQDSANDCIISGLTVYNNYGSTVEKTTAHQMAIYGTATRTIVINCKILADGNDALSLWAPGSGMYYHADLDVRCPGVDILCPRGWCYATRCKFYGDGRALIWHDGRGDYDKKLVITDSHFDSKSPVSLGRYHHDSQFFIINCTMTDKIIDRPICYAYSDQVLDTCHWGMRSYFYNTKRDGGNFAWMKDNLQEAKGSPKISDINAKWTFDGKWDPEATIKSLWEELAY